MSHETINHPSRSADGDRHQPLDTELNAPATGRMFSCKAVNYIVLVLDLYVICVVCVKDVLFVILYI